MTRREDLMEDIFDSNRAESRSGERTTDPLATETASRPVTSVNTLVRQQSGEPRPMVGPNRFLTPVYSTALPPRGLSGVLRRAAYKIPDYKPRRWMLLLAADRVDVLEHMKLGRAVVGVSVFVLAFSFLKILRAA
jgi:hypothetical protein